MFYKAPQAFGLGLQAVWVPPAQGWGANFYFSEEGESIIAPGFDLIFSFYDAPSGSPKTKLWLGSSDEYALYESKMYYSSDLPLRQNLALYLASPEAMRDRGLDQMDALAKKVEATLQSHQSTRCEYGPYKGGGIPPVCTPRPLTAAEEQESLATAGPILPLGSNCSPTNTARCMPRG